MRESSIVVNDINVVEVRESPATADLHVDKNKRISHPPGNLHDYYCNLTQTNISHPLAAYVSYEKLTEEYNAYICTVTKFSELSTLSGQEI